MTVLQTKERMDVSIRRTGEANNITFQFVTISDKSREKVAVEIKLLADYFYLSKLSFFMLVPFIM